MGCATGTCGIGLTPNGGSDDMLRRVLDLIAASSLDSEDPCCAHCAGVQIDPMAQPVSPRDLLAQGSGCPVSILAYRAAREAAGGHTVELEGRGGKLPLLLVDGKRVDVLEDYRKGGCGCGGDS